MTTRAQPRPETAARGPSRRAVTYLRALDIFQDLSLEEIEGIHEITPMRRCHRGTVFYEPGDPVEQLFLLKEGTVTLYRLTPDGRRLVVEVVEAGTIFGEMSVAGQSMQDCFAEAQEDALVCTITRPHLERILSAYPQVSRRLLQVLGRRVHDLQDRLEHMAYGTVRERVARFLLRQARSVRNGHLVAGFTHEQIAEAVGATRQTVSQELNALTDTRVVELRRRRVRLLDTRALRAVAGSGS